MNKKQNRKKKGFTLIELLVVISIIGLLSSIVLAAMKSARDKANVAAFVQNVRQLQIALEMYKNDTGFYPYENDATGYFTNPSVPSGFDDITTYLSLVVVTDGAQKSFIPNYISKFPKRISLMDEISYLSAKFVNFSPTSYTCGNTTPIKGYLIYYINSQSFVYDLPLQHLFINNVYQANTYCVTSS